jgi:SAM-dependent methyltransferase
MNRAQLRLPPSDLRQGGRHFKDDKAFISSGLRDAERLREIAGLDVDSDVLDFGCGAGRFAYGLIETDWFGGSYLGIEVQQRHVDWCTANITAYDPSYRFVHLNSHNERYNPSGRQSSDIPVQDRTVDLFYAYSVFSHMRSGDVSRYLAEVSRVLRASGRSFVTMFADRDVPDETENPDWYGPFEWKNPLHCVLFSLDYIDQLVTRAGLIVDQMLRNEYDGQTGLVLRRVAASSP